MTPTEQMHAVALALLDTLETGHAAARQGDNSQTFMVGYEIDRLVELGAWDRENFAIGPLLGGLSLLCSKILRAATEEPRDLTTVEIVTRARALLGGRAS